MTMESAKTEDEKLQLLFDGELAPEEEAALRRELERSEEARSQLRDWEQLSDALQRTAKGWAGTIDSDALFARIEAEIGSTESTEDQSATETEPHGRRPSLRVVPGGRERRVWGVVAVGLAAAAAVFLAVVGGTSKQAAPTPMARGTEVLEVDFGPNTGTIFEVEGGAGQSLAVVWIDEEEVGLP